MIKFEDYSVRYTLMVDPESDIAFEGTKPFWGGFEIFSNEKGNNDGQFQIGGTDQTRHHT